MKKRILCFALAIAVLISVNAIAVFAQTGMVTVEKAAADISGGQILPPDTDGNRCFSEANGNLFKTSLSADGIKNLLKRNLDVNSQSAYCEFVYEGNTSFKNWIKQKSNINAISEIFGYECNLIYDYTQKGNEYHLTVYAVMPFSGTVYSFDSVKDKVKIQLDKVSGDNPDTIEKTFVTEMSGKRRSDGVQGVVTNFTFEDIPAGDYIITVSKKRHTTRTLRISINRDTALNTRIFLLRDGNNGGAVFNDIPSFGNLEEKPQYYDSVDFCAAGGFMTGYADGSGNFGINDDMQKQDFLCVMARIAGVNTALEKYAGKALPYTDAVKNTYYYGSLVWANEAGIANECDNGNTFGVSQKITREQMAKVLYKYVENSLADVTLTKPANELILQYTDAQSVSPDAIEPLLWAVQNGIIPQNADKNTLNPNGYTKRSDVAIMFADLCERGIL